MIVRLARALALAAACGLIAAAPPEPATAPAPATSPVAVVRATLGNGLRVVIVPDRLAPVVTTEMNYLAGSNDAPAGFPGTAHALEHMMFRGSKGLDRDQLSELGAQLGGDYNADTTETVTQFFYTVAADDLAVALHSEALRMRGLSLKQADWEKERGAIEQEVSRDLSSPFYQYLSQAQAILFTGTPYQHDALGTRQSFDQTDAARIRRFYDRWYAPNNAILVIAGDVDPDKALAQVKAAFDAIPRGEVPAHAAYSLAAVNPQTIALPTDFPVGFVTLAYRMPGLKDRDFAAADVLADVLGSKRGALYGLVPQGHALLSEFANVPKPDVGFGLAYAAFPKGGDAQALLARVRGVIADMRAHGVPPDLVEASKRQEIAQLAFRADSISGLAEGWSQALAFMGLRSPDDLAAKYKAVTVADVNRVAREVLDPARAVTAILTPRNSGKPLAGGGFGGQETFASAPEHPVSLPAWATDALAKLSLPDFGPPPTVNVLPNGLRLIVQPERVTKTISVYGQIRQVSQTQDPPGKDGVASLVGSLFDYGTTQRDRLAFQKALDDIAATEDAGPHFALKVLAPKFDAGMALLAENELQPAFPDEAFTVVRGQLAQSAAGVLQSPGYLFHRAVLGAVVPPGDPMLRQPTPATIMALTPADVRAFYAAAYRPDLTTIVVVGDVTPEQARATVARDFGGWAAQGPIPAVDVPPIGPNPTSQTHVPDSTSLQDSVILAQSVQLPVASAQRYPLMLGNVILGGGFSSRLYQDLRINTGYVYSVSSSIDFSRSRCDYSVSYGADPANVAKARALILRDITTLQSTPATDTELSRAKSQLLHVLQMQEASVQAIAQVYLRLVDLGLPLDTEATAARAFLASTPAAVQDAARKFLRPDGLAQVVKGPPVVQ